MKQKISVSVDREIVARVQEKVKQLIFRNTSHAVEFALNKVLEEEVKGR